MYAIILCITPKQLVGYEILSCLIIWRDIINFVSNMNKHLIYRAKISFCSLNSIQNRNIHHNMNIICTFSKLKNYIDKKQLCEKSIYAT